MKPLKLIVGRHGRPSLKEVFQNIATDGVSLLFKSVRFNGFILREDFTNLLRRSKIRGVEKADCRNAIIIRWGTYCPIETDKNSIVYNQAENLKNCNDKAKARVIMGKAGINTPHTQLISDFLVNPMLHYPLIARPSHHGRGLHAWICNNKEEVRNTLNTKIKGYYVSEIFNKDQEFRVHCFMGKALAVMQKPRPTDNKIVWNRAQNDAPFENINWDNWDKAVVLESLKAITALGLDFGGVDVMRNSQTGEVSICEVNTAPTLNSSPYVCTRWSQAFKLLLTKQTRMEHWDYTKFEKASSLAWKNYQLEGRDKLNK